METIETADYLTIQEAARELSVTDAAVRGAILKGRLNAVVMLGRKVVPRSDLAAYQARTRPDGVKPVGRPRRKAARGPSASTFTTQAALAGPIAEIWDTPEEDEAWAHLAGLGRTGTGDN